MLWPTTNNDSEMLGTWRSFIQGQSYVNDVRESKSGTLEFLRPDLFIERFDLEKSKP